MISDPILKERMAWVEHLRLGLLLILGDDVMDPRVRVFKTVNPLTAILKITLIQPITQASHEPFRTYVRCWAELGECEVPRFSFTRRFIQAEILMKRRIIARDTYGRFT